MSSDPYGRFARGYALLLDPLLTKVHRTVASTLANWDAGTLLDLGCGTGALLRHLARRGPQRALHGLDASPAMLAQARRTTAGTGVELHLADATSLPFAERTFDAAVCSLSLHENAPPTREAMLREASRVARLLVLVDYSAEPPRGLARGCELGLPLIERLAGAAHYAGYRSFLAAGGVEGAVKRTGRTVLMERALLCGRIRCLLAS